MTNKETETKYQKQINESPAKNESKVPGKKHTDVILPKPPDGGYGWVIIFGSFLIHVFADGVSYSMGIFVEEFLHYFGSSRLVVGWIHSLMLGITWTSGPFVSALVNLLGCRIVTIIGACIAAFGFFISIFSPNIYFMYFSLGIIAGLGFGLMYVPAIVSVSFYFEKRRAMATGLAVCGSGFGTVIFAPLSKVLLDEYVWQGAFLILAGLILNCVICGLLFRPLESELNQDSTHETENANQVDKKDPKLEISYEPVDIHAFSSMPYVNRNIIKPSRMIASEHFLHKINTTSIKNSNPMHRKDIFYQQSLRNIDDYRENPEIYSHSMRSLVTEGRESNEIYEGIVEALKSMTDFSLFLNPIFALFAFSNLLTSIGFCVPYAFIPDLASSLGIDGHQGSYIISAIGASNTIGRIVFGVLGDFKCVNKLMLYNTALVICGISTILIPFFKTLELLILYAAIFGCFLGVYVSLTSVVLVDLLGLDMLTKSFGLVLLMQGIGAIVGPPLAGMLYDMVGNYDISFVVIGALIAISGLMLYPIPWIQRCYNKTQAYCEEDIELELFKERQTNKDIVQNV